jgi:hypothetical protein
VGNIIDKIDQSYIQYLCDFTDIANYACPKSQLIAWYATQESFTSDNKFYTRLIPTLLLSGHLKPEKDSLYLLPEFQKALTYMKSYSFVYLLYHSPSSKLNDLILKQATSPKRISKLRKIFLISDENWKKIQTTIITSGIPETSWNSVGFPVYSANSDVLFRYC